MNSNSNIYSLGDITTLITDGKHGDCNDQRDSGYYFLSVKDIKDNRLNYEQARQIERIDFEETDKRTNLQPEDILFTNTGTIGRMAIVPDNEFTRKTTFQKSVAIIKPRKEIIFPQYLFYLLKKEKKRLCLYAEGTTQKNLLLKDLRAFHIGEIPKLFNQKAIAHILGTLDEKIELNRKTNETLEGIAKALFKSWFIDFDPVRAKAEGRSTGLPDEISELFPDSFEDSEIGEIPSGWKISTSESFCESVRDGTHDSPKPVSGDGYPLVTSKNIKGGILDLSSAYKISSEDFHAVNQRSLVLKGDVLISMIGTLGEILYVDEAPNFAIKNVGLFKSKSEELGQWFYLFLQSRSTENFLKVSAQGSTQQYLSLRTLRNIPVILPNESLLNSFANSTKTIFQRKLVIRKEIELLENIRDTLLPKLISGELRVPDAEKMFEEVGI